MLFLVIISIILLSFSIWIIHDLVYCLSIKRLDRPAIYNSFFLTLILLLISIIIGVASLLYLNSVNHSIVLFTIMLAILLSPYFGRKLPRAIPTLLAGDFKGFIFLMNSSEIEDPDKADKYFKQGLIYYNNGNILFAINSFKISIKYYPINHFAYQYLGLSYYKLGKMKKAIKELMKSISINQHGYNSFNILGLAYYSLKEYDLALKYFKESLIVNPNNASVYLNIGTLYSSINDFNKSIYYLFKSNYFDSCNPVTYYSLGISYLELGEFSNAERVQKELDNIDTQFAEELLNIINLRSQSDHSKKEREGFKKYSDKSKLNLYNNNVKETERNNIEPSTKPLSILLSYNMGEFEFIFNQLGFNVFWSDNHIGMIEIIKENHFDVALEWQRYSEDYTVLDAVKMYRPYIPVLLLLNWNGKLPDNFYELKYSGFLKVPIEIEDLRHSIYNCIAAKKRDILKTMELWDG